MFRIWLNDTRLYYIYSYFVYEDGLKESNDLDSKGHVVVFWLHSSDTYAISWMYTRTCEGLLLVIYIYIYIRYIFTTLLELSMNQDKRKGKRNKCAL